MIRYPTCTSAPDAQETTSRDGFATKLHRMSVFHAVWLQLLSSNPPHFLHEDVGQPLEIIPNLTWIRWIVQPGKISTFHCWGFCTPPCKDLSDMAYPRGHTSFVGLHRSSSDSMYFLLYFILDPHKKPAEASCSNGI
jgi:hypothetical protein